MSLKAILDYWNLLLFHQGADLQLLALFRILLGFILFVESLHLTKNGWCFFSEDGVFPRSSLRALKWYRRFSICWCLPSRQNIQWYFLLLSLSALFLSLGFFTFIFAPLTFILMASRRARNPMATSLGDALATILLMYLMLADSSSVLSLDKFFGIPRVGFTNYWVQFLIQFHLTIVYSYAVFHKLNDKNWVSGTIIYHTMSTGLVKRSFPPAPSFIRKRWGSAVVAWGTIAVQLLIALGLWIQEARPFAIAIAVLLHCSLEAFFSIKAFQFYTLSVLVLFLDPHWIAGWLPL